MGKISNKFYWLRKFYYAFYGFYIAFREEKSMLIHTIVSILVLVFSAAIKLNIAQWPIIILTIALVVSLELINTAIENIVDIISFKYNLNAKKVKDISAAATMATALASISISLLVFIPRIIEIVKYGY